MSSLRKPSRQEDMLIPSNSMYILQGHAHCPTTVPAPLPAPKSEYPTFVVVRVASQAFRFDTRFLYTTPTSCVRDLR
jgi:hypothetical protein